MTGCIKTDKFIILEEVNHIELRTVENNFVRSICCEKCLPDLEAAIKKLKQVLRKQK